jgi:hypothetical protein
VYFCARYGIGARSNSFRDDPELEEIIIYSNYHAKDRHGENIIGNVFVFSGDTDVENENKWIHKDSLIPTEITGWKFGYFARV